MKPFLMRVGIVSQLLCGPEGNGRRLSVRSRPSLFLIPTPPQPPIVPVRVNHLSALGVLPCSFSVERSSRKGLLVSYKRYRKGLSMF